jgi:AraC family transcriptional activator of pobA
MKDKPITEIPGVNMADLRLKGYKVHEVNHTADMPISLGRRDFYKMGLVAGNMSVTYGDKIVEIKDPVLFFVNPKVPHGVVRRTKKTSGYACLFTESFMSGRERTELLKNSPLVRTGDSPHIQLTQDQAAFMSSIFQKMLAVYKGDYQYKSELIRSCIELILQEALRIQPRQDLITFKNGATRITHLFFDLLEKQFPIERLGESLSLRTPQDFASELSVHVNYLNRAIKEVTGKPTSVHIAERIVVEAKALLQHTDCSVNEIAFALGFEYPTYFNNYFKRVTGATPTSFRK